MFERSMQSTLYERLQQFPVVALTGPRQSGKTTLLQRACPDYTYFNLESPSTLDLLKTDPKAFLNKTTESGMIIDEAQKFPELFSYVQVYSDEHKKKGQFILSGSQNFLLNQQISQSLAGRAGILELLPLTYKEYLTQPLLEELLGWDWLYHGSYPRPYQDSIPIEVWLDSYLQTYLERDVRDLLQVKNLGVFQRFLRLCAGRHGQILNANQLSIDAGISHTTVNHWLSILEASYIIFKLPAYFKNFNKRLVKSPKLYFYDSGLVCYLLGIDSVDHLSMHAQRGAIFEGYVISEIKKHYFNRGRKQALYYWRDSAGNEVDCLFERNSVLHAIEIKSTSTFRNDLLKGLKKWQRNVDEAVNLSLVYMGETLGKTNEINILSWQEIRKIAC